MAGPMRDSKRRSGPIAKGTTVTRLRKKTRPRIPPPPMRRASIRSRRKTTRRIRVMGAIRRRHRVDTAPGKSEERGDIFSPDLETDRYGSADRTPTGRPSARSEPDLDCSRQTDWFVGRHEHQSSPSEMIGDNSLQQGACVPVERG